MNWSFQLTFKKYTRTCFRRLEFWSYSSRLSLVGSFKSFELEASAFFQVIFENIFLPLATKNKVKVGNQRHSVWLRRRANFVCFFAISAFKIIKPLQLFNLALAMAEIPTRTAQHCAQCTAHGEISLLKGHKKICPFKECTCVHCVLVNNKRQIMAKQVKLKRLQEKNHGLRRARRSQAGKKRSSLLKAKEEEEDVSPEKKYGKHFEVFCCSFTLDSSSFVAWNPISDHNVSFEFKNYV